MSKPNLQQVSSKHELSAEIRALFVSEPDTSFIISDYSSCELRIVANHSKDPAWLKIYEENKDLHSELCALTFDIPVEDAETISPYGGQKYRSIQKTINFGLIYGMSKFKLSNTLKISVEAADAIITKFFAACPKVYDFLEMVGELAATRRYIRTGQPFGRLRKFKGYSSNDSKYTIRKIVESNRRKGKNHPFQGGNADIIKLALVYIYERKEKLNLPVKLILQVHDEIILQVHDSIVESEKIEVKNLMIAAGKVCVPLVPMECEPVDSKVWVK
jgi:DNA polymerase-1